MTGKQNDRSTEREKDTMVERQKVTLTECQKGKEKTDSQKIKLFLK